MNSTQNYNVSLELVIVLGVFADPYGVFSFGLGVVAFEVPLHCDDHDVVVFLQALQPFMNKRDFGAAHICEPAKCLLDHNYMHRILLNNRTTDPYHHFFFPLTSFFFCFCVCYF